MPGNWVEVYHQAHRCKRLQDPHARRQAGKLWFALVRQALVATAPKTTAEVPPESADPASRATGSEVP